MAFDVKEELQEYFSDFPRGHSVSGDVMPWIGGMFNNADSGELAAGRGFAVEPGDYGRMGKDVMQKLFLAAPIAYDVYYLLKHKSILPEGHDESHAILEVANGRYKRVVELMDGIKPLKGPDKVEDLRACKSFPAVKDYYEENASYIIKEMRYEVPLVNQDYTYPVYMNEYKKGTYKFEKKVPSQFSREYGYIGYLAFPMSQLGVMKILSVIFETDDWDYGIIEEGYLENFMAPAEDLPSPMPGERIIDRAYEINEDVAYPCRPFEGVDDLKYNFWARLMLKDDDTRPIPGEFVGMIAKPMPWHCWWYQETCPLLYSGNWFETEFYTSGIIRNIYEKEYDEEDDQYYYFIDEVYINADDGEEGNRYRVEVKGELLMIKATDFYNYSVNERVAVLKSWDPQEVSFDWSKMFDQCENVEGVSEMENFEILSDWYILPVSFYN